MLLYRFFFIVDALTHVPIFCHFAYLQLPPSPFPLAITTLLFVWGVYMFCQSLHLLVIQNFMPVNQILHELLEYDVG